MEVIPAIDLKDGRCVRLYQGDFSKEQVYSDDPVEVARRWEREGAPRIHIVDLDAAVSGRPQNLSIIERLSSEATVPVQVGGGVRGMATLERYLEAGVQRAILGTAAVEDVDFVQEACRRYPESVIIGVDAKDGYVRISGWTRESDLTAIELVNRMEGLGARRFIYTDVSRDGTLTEPNFDAVAQILSLTSAAVIASGGVSSIEHLVWLKEIGVEGAIVGKALYTGDIALQEAIKVAAG